MDLTLGQRPLSRLERAWEGVLQPAQLLPES
jgi:hypothetical protein